MTTLEDGRPNIAREIRIQGKIEVKHLYVRTKMDSKLEVIASTVLVAVNIMTYKLCSYLLEFKG